MSVDLLDVAYIAIGAKRALDRSGLGYSEMPFEGELAYIQACIDQAPLLGQAWQGCSDGFPGVWCYEVAEPFGLAFGGHLLKRRDSDYAKPILERIVASAIEVSPA